MVSQNEISGEHIGGSKMTNMKVCSKCKKNLELVEFYKVKKSPDGLQYYCKACSSTWSKTRRHNNKIRLTTQPPFLSMCSSCGTEKLSTDFYAGANSNGLSSCCKVCMVRNRDVFRRTERGKSTSLASNRKRRATKRGLPHVPYHADDIYARDKGVCVLCGFDVPRDSYHIEHIIPIQVDLDILQTFGIDEHPGDVPHNVSVAHPSCNSSKGNRLTQEHVSCYSLWSYMYVGSQCR